MALYRQLFPQSCLARQEAIAGRLRLKLCDVASKYAQALGAVVLREKPADGSALRLYSLSVHDYLEVEASILRDDPPFPIVESHPFIASDPDILEKRVTDGEPFVLSYRASSRGIGKYLIEKPWQLHRFVAFVQAFPGYDYEQYFQVRPFIETPTDDYYTSFKLVVAAVSGDILAAGLLYADATTGPDELVSTPINQVVAQPQVLRFVQAFEDPDSPFYLASRNIRTGFNRGEVIPLMGEDQARPVSKKEKEILEQHGINSKRPAPPTKLIEYTSWAGRTYGREIDLVSSWDFVQRANTSDKYLFLEGNPGPGPRPFDQCWLRGKGGDRESMLGMRIMALNSLVAMRKRRA